MEANTQNKENLRRDLCREREGKNSSSTRFKFLSEVHLSKYLVCDLGLDLESSPASNDLDGIQRKRNEKSDAFNDEATSICPYKFSFLSVLYHSALKQQPNQEKEKRREMIKKSERMMMNKVNTRKPVFISTESHCKSLLDPWDQVSPSFPENGSVVWLSQYRLDRTSQRTRVTRGNQRSFC